MNRMALAVAAGVAAELSALGLTATAAWLIATAANASSIAALGVGIVAVRAFATFRGPLRYVERLFGHDAALTALAQVRGRVFDSLARDQRRSRRSGETTTRLIADTTSVQDLLLRGVLPATTSAATGLAALVMFVLVLPPAGLVLLAGLVAAGIIVPAITVWLVRRVGGSLAAARADLTDHTLDLADGGYDLDAVGARGDYEARAQHAARRLAQLETRSAAASGFATAAGVIIQGAVTIAVLTIAQPHGTVTTTVLALTALVAIETALPMAGAAQAIAESLPAWRRVQAMLEELPAVEETTSRPGEPGMLRLEDVCVIYGDVVALDSLDADVPAGRHVAIVGASGAGKSTLLAAMSGQVVPSAGAVTVGGPVRGLFADAHVFAATVRANLLLAKTDAADDELVGGLARVYLNISLDDVVGDGGRPLSGGERQRLLLARALLADPPVLVLDEPGESLPHVMADTLLAEVLSARQGRTTIVVTHRIAWLDSVDEVIVMDQGRVVQRGPFDELAVVPGPFADLVAAERLQVG